MAPRVAGRDSDTIEWADISRRLWKRRALVLVITVLFPGIAAFYLSVSTPVYEAKGSIYIGHFDGKPLEQPAVTLSRLQRFGGTAGAWVHKVEQDRKDGRLITLYARAHSPEGALVLVRNAVEETLTWHREELELYRRDSGEELARLEDMSRLARSALYRSKGEGGNGTRRVEYLAAELSLSKQLTSATERVSKLNDLLRNSRQTEAVAPPVLPRSPTGREPPLLLVGAFAAGLLFAVFVALLLESIASGSRQRLELGRLGAE